MKTIKLINNQQHFTKDVTLGKVHLANYREILLQDNKMVNANL